MQRAAGLARLGQRQDLARGQFLAGFPAREGLASWAESRASSASVQSYSTITGAEKSRSSDGTGGSAMPSKVHCWLCVVSSSSAVSDTCRRA